MTCKGENIYQKLQLLRIKVKASVNGNISSFLIDSKTESKGVIKKSFRSAFFVSLRGCNQPTDSALSPASRQIGGIDASCPHDSIQNSNAFVLFLSPHFRGRDWLKPSCISIIFFQNESAPLCVLYIYYHHGTTSSCLASLFMTWWWFDLQSPWWVERRRTEPVRGRPTTAAVWANIWESRCYGCECDDRRESRDLVAYCHPAADNAMH